MNSILGKIVPIVEGDGEVDAVPVLIHRLLNEQREFRFQVAIPKNAHGSGNLLKQGGVERFVRYAWLEPRCVAVMIMVDGDAVDVRLRLVLSFSRSPPPRFLQLLPRPARSQPACCDVGERTQPGSASGREDVLIADADSAWSQTLSPHLLAARGDAIRVRSLTHQAAAPFLTETGAGW